MILCEQWWFHSKSCFSANQTWCIQKIIIKIPLNHHRLANNLGDKCICCWMYSPIADRYSVPLIPHIIITWLLNMVYKKNFWNLTFGEHFLLLLTLARAVSIYFNKMCLSYQFNLSLSLSRKYWHEIYKAIGHYVMKLGNGSVGILLGVYLSNMLHMAAKQLPFIELLFNQNLGLQSKLIFIC